MKFDKDYSSSIAFGIVIGTVLGLFAGNLAVWVSAGLLCAVARASIVKNRNKLTNNQDN